MTEFLKQILLIKNGAYYNMKIIKLKIKKNKIFISNR